MLDLSTAFGNNFYEIKLFDGTILSLKRPTQAIQQTLIDVIPMLEKSEDQFKLIPILTNLFCRILNRNTQDKIFTEEEIAEEFDIALIVYVIQDYFLHWNEEVSSKVDFRTSQQ